MRVLTTSNCSLELELELVHDDAALATTSRRLGELHTPNMFSVCGLHLSEINVNLAVYSEDKELWK